MPLCHLCKPGKYASPIALGVKDVSHFVTASAIAVKVTVFKLNTSGIDSACDESHFYFCLERRIGLPVGADVPGKDEPGIGFPRQHGSPLTSASIVSALIPASARVGLDNRVDGFRLADLVD